MGGIGINCLNESACTDTTPCLAYNMLFEKDGILWVCEGDTMSLITKYIVYKSLRAPIMMSNLYPFLMGMAALKHERIQKFPEIDEPQNCILVAHCGYFGMLPSYFASEWTLRPRALQTNTGEAVGIDMGITDFCITSEAEFYPSPKSYRKAEKALKKAQRKVSRRKKGSNRRRKAVCELAVTHEKVANQRKDIAHKVANELLKKYDTIAHEKLQIRNMVRNKNLSKSISDAGWGIFFNILAYKAESAGKLVLEADPKNTSQLCFSCGNIVKKKLSERWHNCPCCGYSEHRDVNAAKNILKRAIV